MDSGEGTYHFYFYYTSDFELLRAAVKNFLVFYSLKRSRSNLAKQGLLNHFFAGDLGWCSLNGQ
jgi:hypothetical protein